MNSNNSKSQKTEDSLARIREAINASSGPLNLECLPKALQPLKTFEEEHQKILDSFKPISGSIGSLRLRIQINELEEKAQKLASEIEKHTKDNAKATKEIEKLNDIISDLNTKREIQHLFNSVSQEAQYKIENDEEFRSKFTSEDEVESFVVSVDIRRSTELMLKARTPRLFAQFITELCSRIEHIFKSNWAVVDKFTGDGILAFFPAFYSGDDAGYLAMKSITEANLAFEQTYKRYRTSFTSVLTDVGLGAGIDYGKVHLVRMAGALTIVGQPVVYACRLGSAPAGHILVNQPAYEILSNKYAAYMNIQETSIMIKNEGEILAYRASISEKSYCLNLPDWIDDKK